jgi:uroporphyrin-III C-methyltransferase/precorrin-2 dehydrogenase/sirohydrochlorin ferrochelatase
MKTLPILLTNKRFLLIGGGSVALQKANVLQRNTIDVTIIAEQLSPEIIALNFLTIKRAIIPDDLQGFDVVVDATGSDEVGAMVHAYKPIYNYLLNRVDQPDECDFFFSSLLNYGDIKVAISSNGTSPTITQVLAKKIKTIMPKGLATLAKQKGLERKQGVINPQKTRQEVNALFGKVYLIGCGIGDPELLTRKAYDLIQTVDVVFIDHLISDEIIATIPKDTLTIHVGKRKGHHSKKQEEINDLLIEYAQKGLRVGRLKAGDPYIFGRGSEEALAMVKAKIDVEVIPGISSAIAAPLSAGIPPTARGYAANVTIVSAHLRGSRTNLEWIDLLGRKNHTVIVLMGVTRAQAIVEATIEQKIDQTLLVAVISNASRDNQESRMGVLGDLVALAKDAPRPAMLIFGEVVALHDQLPHYIQGVLYDQEVA